MFLSHDHGSQCSPEAMIHRQDHRRHVPPQGSSRSRSHNGRCSGRTRLHWGGSSGGQVCGR
eukprot:11568829-Prorocentrum_lima.AAC.1